MATKRKRNQNEENRSQEQLKTWFDPRCFCFLRVFPFLMGHREGREES